MEPAVYLGVDSIRWLLDGRWGADCFNRIKIASDLSFLSFPLRECEVSSIQPQTNTFNTPLLKGGTVPKAPYRAHTYTAITIASALRSNVHAMFLMSTLHRKEFHKLAITRFKWTFTSK